jgi:predicted phage terminase large subunit-like protein
VLALGRTVHPSYTWGAHHELIARHLEAMLDGTLLLPDGRPCRRLLITTPPQHSKSSLCSQLFPAYALSRNPALKLLLLSYSSTLAEAHSLLALDAARACGTALTLNPDAQARNNWRTKAGGYLISSGIRGTVTGRAAHGIIVDDPHANEEDVYSPTLREKVWSKYTSTVETRLAPGGWIVLIQTRWGDEDLAGKLLASEPDDWLVLRLPALCDDPEHDPLGRAEGEPLWPETRSREWYEERRKHYEDRGLSHHWSSIWQADPRGDGTPREFSQYLPCPTYDDHPDGLFTVLACDPSKSKTDRAGDYAAFTLTSITTDKAPHLYVRSWALRTSANEVSATAVALIEQYRPSAFAIETTMFQSLFMDRILEHVREKGLPCRVLSYTAPQHLDKKTKIRVMLGHLLQQRRVHLYSRSPATKLFQQMLSDFPNDRAHDDLPDSLCMSMFALRQMGITTLLWG